MTRDEILDRVRDVMVELFELDSDEVKLEAHLADDLDLDSIDAIDMVVKLQELTGERVEENLLKQIRTVEDIVDVVETQIAAAASKA
jgi:acyl carrier protein